MKKMKKFEYFIVKSYDMTEHSLNEIGNSGWELCGILFLIAEPTEYYFKREIND